jgi:hypothetical protein
VRSQAPTVIDETEKDSAEGTRFKNQDLSSTLTVDGQNVNWTEIWNINKTIPEYLESNDSDSIDTRSVGSQASTATTVDEDALDALFRGLPVHKGLHNLWPQIVDRQTSHGDAKRIIERFLRRFAEDFECLASKIKKESNGQKVDKHDIALSSSRFVRKYRASIASRIYEAHDIRSETLDVNIEEHGSLIKDNGADTALRHSSSLLQRSLSSTQSRSCICRRTFLLLFDSNNRTISHYLQQVFACTHP